MSFRKRLMQAVGCVTAAAVVVGSSAYLVYSTGASSRYKTDYKPSSLISSGSEIHSGRHTQYHETTETVESPYTVDGYTLRLESDQLQVWVKENTAMLRIVDRRSGYIWGLSTDEKPDDLNKTWYAMASSLCTIEYYDEKGSEKRASTESSKVKLKFEWKQDHFICQIDMTQQEIRLAVEVTLDEDRIRCSVVEDSVEEYGECMLKSLYFMPFLGSTRSDEVDGYFFVPDGCGALLRFQKASAYNAALEGRVYGADPGIDAIASVGNLLASRGNDYLVDENVMSLPVYGIVHGEGQNGIFAIIDGGVEQAYITASVAGVITDYNWVTTRFAYRTSYMKPVNKAGAGVYTPQEEINEIDPSVEYVFLTGEDADYSAMATYYRERLTEDGVLSAKTVQEQIPLWLSILGAEIKEGILYDTTQVLTTIAQGQNITQSLQNAGIKNLMACYYGWEKGGVNGSKYGELKLEGKLGNNSDLTAWLEMVRTAGGNLSLYRNLGQANEDQITLRVHAALNMSSAYTHYTVDNDTLMYPDAYVIKTGTVVENFNKLRQKWSDFSFSLDHIGTNPHSDYERGATTSRLETMQAFADMLKTDSNQSVAVFKPSLYQWKSVSDYLDMPMVSSQYVFETDTVPFLQMVLKGSVTYYTPYVNLGFYSDNAVLKMVEYGACPAFIVAQAESHTLENTPLENMFSVNFQDWEETIYDIYGYVSEALNAVEGMYITEHQMVADGVARVTYDGGVRIYVNYNDEDIAVDGLTVPARDYVVEGERK